MSNTSTPNSLKDYFGPEHDGKRNLSELSSVGSMEEHKKPRIEHSSAGEDSFLVEPMELVELNKEVLHSMNRKLDNLFEGFKASASKEITELFNDFSEKIKTLELKVNSLEKAKTELNQKNDSLNKKVSELERKVVDIEQHSRKSNVRIFGLKEDKNENVKEKVAKLISSKLDIDLQVKDIDAAHRLPQTRKDRPKPIIVKLFARDKKALIMKNRSKLKSSGISINEDLCRPLQLLLNRVSKHEATKSAWAWNGNIYYENTKGFIRKATYGEPLIQ